MRRERGQGKSAGVGLRRCAFVRSEAIEAESSTGESLLKGRCPGLKPLLFGDVLFHGLKAVASTVASLREAIMRILLAEDHCVPPGASPVCEVIMQFLPDEDHYLVRPRPGCEGARCAVMLMETALVACA